MTIPRRDSRGRWDLGEAVSRQRRLRERVVAEDRLGPVHRIAGADVSYDRRGSKLYAAAVLLDAETLHTIATASVVAEAAFPYLPGFLALREAPAVAEAVERLATRPDLLLVDGHGQAHPRGFGIACHLGLALDIPTIGAAKSPLVGTAELPAEGRGATRPVVHRGSRVGAVVRTRDRVAPVYVSVGHRIALPTAVEWVLRCGAGFRIPEPTRRAHAAVNGLRSAGGRP
jgi:deoxyribonuclease V